MNKILTWNDNLLSKIKKKKTTALPDRENYVAKQSHVIVDFAAMPAEMKKTCLFFLAARKREVWTLKFQFFLFYTKIN
jgi:hypothetical protein